MGFNSQPWRMCKWDWANPDLQQQFLRSPGIFDAPDFCWQVPCWPCCPSLIRFRTDPSRSIDPAEHAEDTDWCVLHKFSFPRQLCWVWSSWPSGLSGWISDGRIECAMENLFQGAPCLAGASLNAGHHSHILSFLRQLCWVWSRWPSSQSGWIKDGRIECAMEIFFRGRHV